MYNSGNIIIDFSEIQNMYVHSMLSSIHKCVFFAVAVGFILFLFVVFVAIIAIIIIKKKFMYISCYTYVYLCYAIYMIGA